MRAGISTKLVIGMVVFLAVLLVIVETSEPVNDTGNLNGFLSSGDSLSNERSLFEGSSFVVAGYGQLESTPTPDDSGGMGGGEADGTLQPSPPPPPSTPVAGGSTGGSGNNGGSPQETYEPVASPKPEAPPPQEIHHYTEVHYPYDDLESGISGALKRMFLEMQGDIQGDFKGTLEEFENNIPTYQEHLEDVRFSAWKVSLGIAGILTPLILAIVVSLALKEGATSVLGYAAARESLLNWVISVAAAISSYFILDKVLQLSKALESAIMELFTLNISSMHQVGISQIASNILPDSPNPELNTITLIIMVLFSVFLIAAYALAFIMAWCSIQVLLLMTFSLAPIIIIAGVLQPFRWLQGLWTKITTITFLLWPLNIFLLGLCTKILTVFAISKSGSFKNFLLGFTVAVGILSIFIALNTMIGKLVYGAAIEVAGKLKATLMGAANLAMIGLGAGSVGSSILKSIGSGGSIPGGENIPGGIPGDDSPGGAAARSQIMSQQNLANNIANAFAATNLPGMSGLAAGLRMNAARDANNQLSQLSGGINQAISSPTRLQGSLNTESSSQKTIEAINQDYGSQNSRMAMAMEHDEFSARVNSGVALADATISSMQKQGDISTLLGEMNYPGNLQSATDNHHRWIAERNFLRNDKGFSGPSIVAPASKDRISARDYIAANEIVNRLPPQDSSVFTESFMSKLSNSVFHRRINKGQSHTEIIKEAKSATSIDLLKRWIDS